MAHILNFDLIVLTPCLIVHTLMLFMISVSIDSENHYQ
ncbi:hypothetical protein KR50_07300 [Jeotgalibacillus campisalis]|uniref:Uncharacterized protein n=1 Tax=Jeotgalibacillus campisalis TaxID=220754 RepID=A0A0C2W465_9BACL|nr:hypothetical protein KR50_07300 [Jeotgalibacillus campisalis]